MHAYSITISLPKVIQSKLASLCCGLPQVEWVEKENLHLTLGSLGPLSSTRLIELQERLELLFFFPFSFVLQSIDYFPLKNKRGVIGVGIKDQLPFASLKKEISRCLREVALPSQQHFPPHVIMGHCERLNSVRLRDYLMTFADYQSEPLHVSSCSLMQIHQTPKRTIYQTLFDVFASPQIIEED